jgi:PAS domain S-box-containing protein
MKKLISTLAGWLSRLSPVTIFALGLAYEMALGTVDYVVPGMSFTLFYLLGVAFVGWGAGGWTAALLSAITAAIMTFEEWAAPENGLLSLWVAAWNTSSRFGLFCAAGWLTAEVTRLTQDLGSRVEARTAQWKTEAEQHKETSECLADALDLNQKMLQASTIGIAAYKASGECVFVNHALARIAGGTIDQILEGNFRRLEGWQQSGLLSLAEQVLQQGQPQAGEFCDTTRFGKTVWVDAHMAPFIRAGEPHLLVMSYDITERKRAELLLRAQRDLGVSLSLTSNLQTALDRLLEIGLQMEGIDCGGVFITDPKTGDLHMVAHRGRLSEAFVAHACHYPADSPRAQLIKKGQPIYDLYERLPSWRDQIRNQEGLRTVAILPLCHEGGIVGTLNLASHTHDAIPPQTRVLMEALAAQAAGAIARIRAETALQQSEARLRTIITGVPIVLFAVDQDGRMIFEDGRALAAVGIKPGEHVGRLMAEVFGQYPMILEHLRRALAGEEFSASVELRGVAFDCWYCPTRDQAGRLTGFIGVANNITERQGLERQILEISDREQARIGQDIHDGLCQQLVSLAFDANSLEDRLKKVGRPEAATASRIALYLDHTISEARQLSRGLFPIRLEAEGLPSALEELAKTTHERSHMRCRFENNDPIPVKNSAIATHLYRIAQEAVNNAVKHSQAKNISIQLLSRPEHLELTIEDDGVGLAPPVPGRRGGMGLHIMDYRARSLGGTLRTSPGSHGGTTVSCCVPYPRS